MYIKHEMKVIGHQAPGGKITIWQNVFLNFLQKEHVIVCCKENFLAIVSLVVDVV